MESYMTSMLNPTRT